jgi:hypothetical protein
MMDPETVPAGLALDRQMAALLDYEITIGGHCLAVDASAELVGDAWSPSRVIGDAWEVIERMRTRGLMPAIDCEADGSWFVSWTANTTAGESGVGHYADTAPLAICRAALLALKRGSDAR